MIEAKPWMLKNALLLWGLSIGMCVLSAFLLLFGMYKAYQIIEAGNELQKIRIVMDTTKCFPSGEKDTFNCYVLPLQKGSKMYRISSSEAEDSK